MGLDLFAKQVLATYDSLLKVGDNDTLTGTPKRISDGRGNDSPIWLGTTRIGIGLSPESGVDLQTNIGKFGSVITTSLRIDGSLTDSLGEVGTENQVLISTGSATKWASISAVSGVSGTGTTNTIPLWTSGTSIGNSILTQSGSTIDVNGKLYADTIQLSGGTGDQGTLSWNVNEETLDLIQNGSTLQIGQEVQIHCKNQTGTIIPDGTPVYVTGTLGASGRLTIAPMIADGSIPAKYFIGVTTEAIADGDDGKVTTFGKIRGLNTSAYSEGQTLWVSATTAGAFTTTRPVAPNLDLEVAIVINSHVNNGTLFVRSSIGHYLGTAHDVNISSVAENDLLVYKTNRWVNSKSIGDLSADNVTLTGHLRGPEVFIIDPAAYEDNAGIVQILGNLRVDGETTTINSTTISVSDKNITLAKDAATAGDANGAGITIAGANATLTYLSATDDFTFNKKVNATEFIGPLTGDVTGNADTASALETAVNIALDGSVTGNADFDGSGNITITTTTNHNHDDRYYTETETGNFFSGATAITGYNKTNWDAAYNAKINSGYFNSNNGDLVLTRQDDSTLEINFDDRYVIANTGNFQSNTYSVNSGIGTQRYLLLTTSGQVDQFFHITINRAYDYGDNDQTKQQIIYQRRNSNKNLRWRLDGDTTASQQVFIEIYAKANGDDEVWLVCTDYAKPQVYVEHDGYYWYGLTTADTPTGTLIKTTELTASNKPNWEEQVGLVRTTDLYSDNTYLRGSTFVLSTNGSSYDTLVYRDGTNPHVLYAGGGTSTQWNTAYNYSQVGHLPLTGGTLSGPVVVNIGNVTSDTVAFKVGGPGNYDSLTMGIEDSPDYDSFIASYGNDIRFYSGKDVGTENHSFYWFTSKAGTSQHNQVAMLLDHNQNLSVTSNVYVSGGNSTLWNTAYGWGNHAGLYSLVGHTHDLIRHSLAAPALIDSMTSTSFRTSLFGSNTNGYAISTSRWNTTPTALSGMNSYGTLFAWSGADTHGFIATDYSTANIQVGGGYGDNITWKATLIHSANIASQSVNYAVSAGAATTSITFVSDRTNYKGYTDNAVSGQLMWKQYGNNHTIFDASAGTSPSGTTVSRHTPDYPVLTSDGNNSWGINPNLMGWNGGATYGVKVDWSRYSETSGNAGLLDSIDSSQFLRSDESDTMAGNLTVNGVVTAESGLLAIKTSKSAYGMQIKGAYYGSPRLQLYDLAVDGNAFLGLGVDMSGGSYEFSNYFPRYSGYGRWSVGSWAGDFGTGQHVSGYNEKMYITESAAVVTVPFTSSTGGVAITASSSQNTGLIVDGGTNSGIIADFRYGSTKAVINTSGGGYFLGSVCIGSTSPSGKLDIAYDMYSGAATGVLQAGAYGNINFKTDSSTGAFTSQQGITWQVNNYGGSTNYGVQAQIAVGNDGNVGTFMGFFTSNNYGAPPVERIRIQHNGNVGIGKTSGIDYKLDVSGTGRFSENVTINGTIIGTDQTFGGAYRTFAFGTNANGFNRIFAANDQSDGIYINAATGKGLNVRVNGGGDNVFSIASTGAATFLSSVTIGASTALNFGQRGGISQDGSYNFNWSTNGVANAFHLQSATGNIGINTISPSQKLSVEGGNIKLNHDNAAGNYYLWLNKKEGQDGGIIIGRDNALDWQIVNATSSGDLWYYSYGTGSVSLLIKKSNGYVGIGTGTANPSTKLEVGNYLDAETNSITVAGRYEYQPQFVFRLGQAGTGYSWTGAIISCGDDGNYNGAILFKTANAGRDTPTIKMVIKANGNVGIGKTSGIDYKLDVATATIKATNNILIGEEAFNASADYVGMKTTFQSGSYDYMILSGKADGATYVSAKDGEGVYVRGGGNNGGNQIYVPDSTYIQVTTSAFNVSGDVLAYSTSDSRLKDNVKPIENAIDKVKAIGGYEFDWNEKQEVYEGHDIGVIAQEVEAVFPELVTTRESGYKAVKYEKLTALLIEAIKEQQKQIDELKAIINGSTK